MSETNCAEPTIVEFLTARLAETQGVAEAARAELEGAYAEYSSDELTLREAGKGLPPDARPGIAHRGLDAWWDFAARHQRPSVVLADVAAKHELLAQMTAARDLCPEDEWPDDGDMMKAPISDFARHLLLTWVQAYADHSGFDPAWRLKP